MSRYLGRIEQYSMPYSTEQTEYNQYEIEYFQTIAIYGMFLSSFISKAKDCMPRVYVNNEKEPRIHFILKMFRVNDKQKCANAHLNPTQIKITPCQTMELSNTTNSQNGQPAELSITNLRR